MAKSTRMTQAKRLLLSVCSSHYVISNEIEQTADVEIWRLDPFSQSQRKRAIFTFSIKRFLPMFGSREI